MASGTLDKMTGDLPQVTVVMATFNGEKYLREQLESILKQIGVEVSVLVVDDGSTDSTLEIIREYKTLGLVSHVIETDRIGASSAFYSGLFYLSTAEWICFSDQDDIWETKKIQKAIESAEMDVPILVCGGRKYINERNQIVGESVKLRRIPHWKNALTENICYGNTILINQKGFNLLKRYRGHKPEIFDAWIYLVFALQGSIIYLRDSGTKYRLHESNAVGVGRAKSYRALMKNQEALIKNALIIREVDHNNLSVDFLKALSRFEKCLSRSAFQNLLAPFYLVFFRQRMIDSLILRIICPFVYKKSKF